MARVAMKSATYCMMHLTVAVAVAYALTQDWRIALGIGIIEPLVQTVFFTAHDRLWARADGKRAANTIPAHPRESGDPVLSRSHFA